MKAVVRNLTGSTITLPAVFNSFPLPAGQDKDFIYAAMPAVDLEALVSLAKGGSISFPGSAGLGIAAGLPVTSSLIYVLNGQEPAGMPAGFTVWSINDNGPREFDGVAWAPRTGKDFWLKVSDATERRFASAMVSLADGRILAMGGVPYNTVFNPQGGELVSCEIYDPATDTWSAAASLPSKRAIHGAITLRNGKVLMMGGRLNTAPAGPGAEADFKSDCYLYDPELDTWTATGSMPYGVPGGGNAKPVLLHNGDVMLLPNNATGAIYDIDNRHYANTKTLVYSVDAGTWSEKADRPMRAHCQPVLLRNGDVFVSGGPLKTPGNTVPWLGGAEVYSVKDNSWTPYPAMPTIAGEDDADTLDPGARGYHTAVLLPTGLVLIAGGVVHKALTRATGAAASIAPAPATIAGGSNTGVGNTQITPMRVSGLTGMAAGMAAIGTRQLIEISGAATGGLNRLFEIVRFVNSTTVDVVPYGQPSVGWPAGFPWAADANNGALTWKRREHVLVSRKSCLLFDAANVADPWSRTADMNISRQRHFCFRQRAGGGIVVAGGANQNLLPIVSSEIFDPMEHQWLLVDDMQHMDVVGGIKRSYINPILPAHNAVVLPTGKLFVAHANDTVPTVSGGVPQAGKRAFIYTPGLPVQALIGADHAYDDATHAANAAEQAQDFGE